MRGLWSEHFPPAEKSPPPPSTPPRPPPRDGYERCLLCPFCSSRCRIFTSSTEKNPNRNFYTCQSKEHKFFKWADDVSANEFIDVPSCGGCNAGVCRVSREKSGKNAGRILFMCRIKEGEGSCGYRVWQDELERESNERTSSSPTAATSSGGRNSINVNFVDQRPQSNEKADKKSPANDNKSSINVNFVDQRPQSNEKADKKSPANDNKSSINVNFVDQRPQSNDKTNKKSPANDNKSSINVNFVDKRTESDERADKKSPVNDSKNSINVNFVDKRTERDETADKKSPVNESRNSINVNFVDTRTRNDETADKKSPENDSLNSINVNFVDKRTRNDETADKKSPENDRRNSINVNFVDKRTRNDETADKKSPKKDSLNSMNVNFVDKRTQNDETADKKSPVNDGSQRVQYVGAVPRKIRKFKHQDEKSHESSRRSPKSSHGDFKGSLTCDRPHTVHLVEKSASIQHSWMAAAISQNLSDELQGWWGRLAFHPMPSMGIHASTDVSSTATVDPSEMHSNALSTETESSQEVRRSSDPSVHNAELVADTSPSLVAQDLPATRRNNYMSDAVSKKFSQAAMALVNDFLTLLATMDAEHHEAISREADVTFAALDCLKVDHQDFKERVKELIHSAKTLSDIEQSMSSNDSYQKLLDSERSRLDEINHNHAELVKTIASMKSHLKNSQEKISSVRTRLLEMESEVSSYEDEIQNMEQTLDEINESRENLEEKYGSAAKVVKELQALCARKKSEHDAAKVAYATARSLLYGHKSAAE
ncbi:uncharacterized protein LOC127255905 [Andrographis paniculata]|uniref:uncharacterized protein LOC127255905 n=1 Tax=Andrographis paniculata TaxID=175694 RepID=UPI0021E815C2|nr:uncharacterized protein LOC127255905 [Andrographis paniculata]